MPCSTYAKRPPKQALLAGSKGPAAYAEQLVCCPPLQLLTRQKGHSHCHGLLVTRPEPAPTTSGSSLLPTGTMHASAVAGSNNDHADTEQQQQSLWRTAPKACCGKEGPSKPAAGTAEGEDYMLTSPPRPQWALLSRRKRPPQVVRERPHERTPPLVLTSETKPAWARSACCVWVALTAASPPGTVS